jgi:hypothetical protein
MVLRTLVCQTLRENSLNVGLTDQVVTALALADIPQIVKEKDINRVRTLIKKQALAATAIRNPLQAQAAFNHNEGLCPYCKKQMREITIRGDLIKKARFCPDDRITLPYPIQ